MNAIRTTVKNGQVSVAVPADWPEGCEVLVEAVSATHNGVGADDDGPATAEVIAQRLALMDQIEPLLMTPEEEAEWKAARKAQKEREKAAFAEQTEALRRMWE